MDETTSSLEWELRKYLPIKTFIKGNKDRVKLRQMEKISMIKK